MVRRWLIAGGTIFTLVAATASLAQQAPAVKPNDAAKPAVNASAKKPATKPHKTKAKAKSVETQDPIAEVPPPPPPTPEQSPAAAPQVSFKDGELSIRSDNATLGSILNAVKSQTGASVDAPGSAGSDRVATQLGPGDPRDVLTTLLNNSKYDFILLGAPGSPNSVQKIILTARAANAGNNGGGAPAAAAANRAAPRNFQVPAEVEQDNTDQELPDAEVPDDGSQPDQPPQPEQAEPQPPNGEPNQQNGEQPGNPNQPKTPEQLLQELQRMQQQQQQQQEQQRQQNLNPQ